MLYFPHKHVTGGPSSPVALHYTVVRVITGCHLGRPLTYSPDLPLPPLTLLLPAPLPRSPVSPLSTSPAALVLTQLTLVSCHAAVCCCKCLVCFNSYHFSVLMIVR